MMLAMHIEPEIIAVCVHPGFWPAIIDSLVRAGMTHAEVARRLKVPRVTVFRWYHEEAQPNFVNGVALIQLSRREGISVTDK